jgi:hypothetical protein
MEDTAERGGEIERRNPQIEATRRELSGNGRQPHERKVNGNVRTYVWFNHLDESVPTYVEQLRYYSTKTNWNTTRLLEASDLRHALRGLEEARNFVAKNRLLTRRPPDIDPDAVRASVMKGVDSKWKFYHRGNVAAIAWNNPADKYDFVLKVDLLNVVAPNYCKRYFLSSQIPDAEDCLIQVGNQLLSDYLDEQKKWRGVKS